MTALGLVILAGGLTLALLPAKPADQPGRVVEVPISLAIACIGVLLVVLP